MLKLRILVGISGMLSLVKKGPAPMRPPKNVANILYGDCMTVKTAGLISNPSTFTSWSSKPQNSNARCSEWKYFSDAAGGVSKSVKTNSTVIPPRSQVSVEQANRNVKSNKTVSIPPNQVVAPPPGFRFEMSERNQPTQSMMNTNFHIKAAEENIANLTAKHMDEF